MSTKARKRSQTLIGIKRSVAVNLSLGSVLVLLVASLILLLLVTATPGYYRSSAPTAQERSRLASAFQKRMNEAVNAAQTREAFTWSFRDSELNSYLAEQDPIKHSDLPEGISSPQVFFKPDTVIVTFRLTDAPLKPLISERRSLARCVEDHSGSSAGSPAHLRANARQGRRAQVLLAQGAHGRCHATGFDRRVRRIHRRRGLCGLYGRCARFLC